MPLNLIWQLNGNTIRDGSTDGSLIHPINFPGVTGDIQTVTLQTSAQTDQTFASLTGLQLYLQGDLDQLNTILNIWPAYGNASNPPRTDLNGGLEISFDGGATFHRFGFCPLCQARLGDPADPSTWLTIPAMAISPSDGDGVLGPFSTASMLLRYRIPPQADQFEIFNVRLEAAFDVI